MVSEAHPHVPAADADLHAPGPRPARRNRREPACSACGTARPRCRPAASKRPWRRSARCSAQLFGQSEAPMMISTLAPADHFRDDGSLATERLSCAGCPTPLTTVAIMDDEGTCSARASAVRSWSAARWSWPATTRTRRPRRKPPGMAGTTPGTSATSTRTATCSSSTAPRT